MDSYQTLGIANIVLLIILIYVLIVHFPTSSGANTTFGQHAAQSRALHIYYIAIFVSTFVPLAWLLMVYIVPKYDLPAAVTVLGWLAALSQIMSACIPESSPKRTRWSRIFAGITAGIMAVLVLLFMLATPTMRYYSMVGGMFMSAAALWLLIRHPHGALIAQTALYLGFFIPYTALLLG